MRAPPLPASVPCSYSMPNLPRSRSFNQQKHSGRSARFQLSRGHLLVTRWSSGPLHPCAPRAMDRPRYTGVGAKGWVWGWAVGRGSSASLPGSGLTQVRSCPQGLNQVTRAPGGQRQTAGPIHALRPRPNQADREFPAQRHSPRDSPVESGRVRRAPVLSSPTPPSPAGDGPA